MSICHTARVLVVELLSVALMACSGDRRPGVIVTDSAGVMIIENQEPMWQGEDWRIGNDPVLEIGTRDSPSHYQFDRIEHVLRLDDGVIVVADGGSAELRFFDSSGHFVTSSGGRGNAPGEYQMIESIGAGPGDSIWVYDFGARRFTVLTSNGIVSRTMTLDGTLSNVGAVGRLDDGSFVVREYWSSRRRDMELVTGLRRDPAAIARYSPDGLTIDTIGLFPGREVFIGSENGRAVMSAPLFAHSTSAAVANNTVIIGDQNTFQIGLYSSDGVLTRLVRLLDIDLRLTEQDIAQLKQQRLAAQPPATRPSLSNHMDRMDVPANRPAYREIVVDELGNLWVEDYQPEPRKSSRWTIVASDGRLLGTIGTPPTFKLLEVGDTWVLGVGLDEVDVEYVRLYKLDKSTLDSEDQDQLR